MQAEAEAKRKAEEERLQAEAETKRKAEEERLQAEADRSRMAATAAASAMFRRRCCLAAVAAFLFVLALHRAGRLPAGLRRLLAALLLWYRRR